MQVFMIHTFKSFGQKVQSIKQVYPYGKLLQLETYQVFDCLKGIAVVQWLTKCLLGQSYWMKVVERSVLTLLWC